jgi:PKD repeat protein
MRVPNLRKLLQHPLAARTPSRSQGQSLVELALILPVFLLIVLIGLDFGRVYAGWVTLNQAARTAANYAAVNPDAWGTPGSYLRRQHYQDLITAETTGINCVLPSPAPDPVWTAGKALGDPVSVSLDCQFQIITPIISAILPNPLTTSASSTFVIRTGLTIADPPACEDTGTCPALPQAHFATVPSQASGTTTTTLNPGGQNVEFIDATQGGTPISWSWDFGDGSATSSDEFPVHTYTNGGSTTLTYYVTMQACNLAGCDTATGTIIIPPLASAPAAAFHWCTGSATTCNPLDPGNSSGTAQVGPITIQFTDDSSGSPTSWSWDFGDGSGLSTAQNPSHTYSAVSSTTIYTITLTATNSTGFTTASLSFHMSSSFCTTPTFTGNDPISTGTGGNKNKWQTDDVTTVWQTTSALWTGGGFAGSIVYTGGTPTPSTTFFKITSQTPNAGTIQLCTTTLTVVWSTH